MMRGAIVGGSGLVGGFVSQELLGEATCSELVSISRRSQGSPTKKLREIIGPLSDLDSLCAGLQVDAAFCCLGTTIRKAGSKQAFADIDQHLVLRFARAIRSSGVQSFHVVSALGADAQSPNFYLQAKGLMEEGLRKMDFPALYIYRPSLLLGSRAESRPMERMSILVYHLIQPFYPKFLQAWQPIEARDVARSMVKRALSPQQGVHIVENKEMHRDHR